MKPNRVLLQATSIIVALVITLYFSYVKVAYAETQGKNQRRLLKRLKSREISELVRRQ